MAHLPFDVWRCVGDFANVDDDILRPHPACLYCRRREPGHPTHQSYKSATPDENGACDDRIAPVEN